jgi:hypothetical protein
MHDYLFFMISGLYLFEYPYAGLPFVSSDIPSTTAHALASCGNRPRFNTNSIVCVAERATILNRGTVFPSSIRVSRSPLLSKVRYPHVL